jgi:hypothetical protein
MRSSAESIFNGSPRLFAGPPRNAPTSSSISSLFVAINEGFSAVGALVYPHGLLISVPLTTTEERRP